MMHYAIFVVFSQMTPEEFEAVLEAGRAEKLRQAARVAAAKSAAQDSNPAIPKLVPQLQQHGGLPAGSLMQQPRSEAISFPYSEDSAIEHSDGADESRGHESVPEFADPFDSAEDRNSSAGYGRAKGYTESDFSETGYTEADFSETEAPYDAAESAETATAEPDYDSDEWEDLPEGKGL